LIVLLYSSLDDVPLPETIYNGPLDELIVPLVKAIQPFAVITMGSCQGHLDRFYPYPWVQLNPYDNLKLLKYLVDKSNGKERIEKSVSWYLQGNVLRTEREARDSLELDELQDGVAPLAQFVFQYRPEILDPNYCRNNFQIPPSCDPVYEEISRTINQLLAESISVAKRQLENPTNKLLENSFREKVTLLQLLQERERNYIAHHGDTIELPVSNQQVDRWLEKAKRLLD